MIRPRALILFVSLSCGAFVACGGGGSTPGPQPVPTLGGLGSTVPLDQHINFTVLVPPAPVLNGVAAGARKRRRFAAGGATTTNPYVSPNTGSVLLQLQTVNGQSLRQAPPPNPPANIPSNCIGSASGCSVPIQNVTAAKGANRFEVETFSGQNGGGNVVSTGFIDVTVPSAQSTSFGGTTLTIGGYVAQLLLALNPPGGGFIVHTPGTAAVDVNAIDPAGAIIIGNSILANPITVALGGSDTTNFTLNGGAAPITLQQPMQSVTLAYDGKITVGGEVDATTIDENGNPVNAKVVVPVMAQTPPPAPSATPLSIYVYDASADRILEYDHVRAIEQGVAPAPAESPRRIFQFSPPPSGIAGGANTFCNAPAAAGPDLGGIAVDAAGTIYAESGCTDPAVTKSYTFSYPASTQQIGSTPPPATVAFAATTVDVNNAGFGAPAPSGIKLEPGQNKAFVGYQNSFTTAVHVIGFSIGSTASSSDFGADCIGELTYGCQIMNFSPSGYYLSAPLTNFAVDGAGNAYVPTAYNDVPPGPPAFELSNQPAVAAVLNNAPNPSPTELAYSALADMRDELGTTGTGPAVSLEGATLYALAQPASGPNNPPLGTPNAPPVWPGLSYCPPPSANAPLDVPASTDSQGITLPPNCADQSGSGHTYLVGFPAAPLTAASAGGQDLFIPPTFVLGGDKVGGFGNYVAPDGLAVTDGFAYVLNDSVMGTLPGQPPYATEIDVYDVRTITGSHTDTGPVAKISLPADVFPTSITIGPTGTGTGGFNLALRGGYPHHNIKAWLQQRLLQQRRLPLRHHR